jgi:hypothetical protein
MGAHVTQKQVASSSIVLRGIDMENDQMSLITVIDEVI